MAKNPLGLLHPLAEPWYECRNHQNEAAIDFNDPQPVLLNGDIYMKGQYSPKGHLRLWKYSISARIFSELQCPPECNNKFTNDDRYLLTSLQSNLLLIHASFTCPNTEFPNEEDYDEISDIDDFHQICHKLELRSFKLLETGWDKSPFRRSFKSTDPLATTELDEDIEGGYHRSYRSFLDKNRARDPLHWDVSITSSDDRFFVALFRRDDYGNQQLSDRDLYRYGRGPFLNAKILIFNENLQFINSVQGPSIHDNEDSKISKPAIFIHGDNFYVKVWTSFDNQNFRKASLTSILAAQKSNFTSHHIAWHDSHSIPEMSSNITLLQNQLVLGISPPTVGGSVSESFSDLTICALTSCISQTQSGDSGDTWVEVANFNCRFDLKPIIVGVPDGGKLVAIGNVNDGSNQELHVLEAIPQG
jgi:hypothetical protein